MRSDWNYRQIDTNTALLFDYLRGISATVVVTGHAAYYFLSDFKKLGRLALNTGHLAVSTFFIISGFMICSSLLRRLYTDPNGKLDVQRFALDRLKRLAPPLIVMMPIMLACYLFLITKNHAGYGHYWSVKQAMATVFFLLTMKTDIPAPYLNGPLWSLSHELWFYVGGALIALSLAARQKFQKIVPLIILIALLYGVTTLKWGMGFVVWLNGGLLAVFYHRQHNTSNRGIIEVLLARITNSNSSIHANTKWTATLQSKSGLLVLLLLATLCLFASYFVTGHGTGYGRYVYGILLAATVGSWFAHQELVQFRRATDPLTPTRKSSIGFRLCRLIINAGASVAPYSYTLYVIHFPLLLVSFELSRQWLNNTSGALFCLGIYLICALLLSNALAKVVENPKRLHYLFARLRALKGS